MYGGRGVEGNYKSSKRIFYLDLDKLILKFMWSTPTFIAALFTIAKR